jgi:hypothetical protein
MSSATQPSPPATEDAPSRVVLISHSQFFYWWPVWGVGFLMAAVTYLSGEQIAFVPPGTVAVKEQRIEGQDGPRDALIAPAGQPLPVGESGELRQPRLRMMSSNNPGVVWAVTLCLVIAATHIPLRGFGSVLAILIVIFLTILFAYLQLWNSLLEGMKGIDIHITASGYLTISMFLFVLWLVSFLLFDRMTYMVFSRGQLRVRLAVGVGETVYDTRGMVVQKHRDALFRHWILGFGSGDLTVTTSGGNSQQFELPNVLFIGHKVELIHTMLQEREVVRGSR